LNSSLRPGYNRIMSRIVIKAALIVIALAAATGAVAQNRKPDAKDAHPAPAVSGDKRDAVVTGVAPYSGRPYWLALAQCGGVYFKLNVLYTDIAVHARVVKPDPRVNDEFTRKLTEAIRTATTFFDGADHFLMNDRGIERMDAVLIYNDQSRVAGDRVNTVDEALTAAKSCPVLYQACHSAYPKACDETLTLPTG
jgi:hypothetical protein